MVVDISPAQTSTRTNFRYYIQAMQEVKISSDIPRSTARRMAEDQLRKLVKVGTPFKYEYVSCSSVDLTWDVGLSGGCCITSSSFLYLALKSNMFNMRICKMFNFVHQLCDMCLSAVTVSS